MNLACACVRLQMLSCSVEAVFPPYPKQAIFREQQFMRVCQSLKNCLLHKCLLQGISESPAVVASDWPKITLNCCRHLNILLHRQLVETLNLPCFGQARVQQSLPMNFVKTVTKSVSARFGSYWISLATVCS